MSRMHQVGSYIHYWLNAVDRHSLQAPFVYDLYNKVIKNGNTHQEFQAIENLRNQFKESKDIIEVEDYGAGSRFSKTKVRVVGDIARKGITSGKYSAMLYQLCTYLNASNIIELGTSLGINTLYLSISDLAKVTTFEASPALCEIAEKLLKYRHRKNTRIVRGNIDETLAPTLDNLPALDVAFVDANHRYESTINYFNLLSDHSHPGSCIVFDDIHWSQEMEQAWKYIKSRPSVTLSVDLYQMGLVFFNPDLRKQEYILQF